MGGLGVSKKACSRTTFGKAVRDLRDGQVSLFPIQNFCRIVGRSEVEREEGAAGNCPGVDIFVVPQRASEVDT